jgi:hypothetical protein
MKCRSCLGDCAHPNRVLNPVRVTRCCDAPPPPPPDPLHKRGRAERRDAVIGNTGSYLSIFFIEQKLPASRHGEARRCPPLLRGGRGCVTVSVASRYCSPSFRVQGHGDRTASVQPCRDAARRPGDHANPNRVLNPVRVTRDCDAPPRGLLHVLHGRYHNTPPTPSQEGRAGCRGAVIGNTDRHLITNKGACPLAECGKAIHPVRDGSSVENRYAAPLASRTGCNINGRLTFLPNFHSSRNDGAVIVHITVQPPAIVAQCFSASPNIWAKAPVVCGDHRAHRLKPGAIQNSDGDRTKPRRHFDSPPVEGCRAAAGWFLMAERQPPRPSGTPPIEGNGRLSALKQ